MLCYAATSLRMDPSYVPFVVFLTFFLVVGVAILGRARVFAARRRIWELLARKHGFTLRGSYFSPLLEGRYAGVGIEVRLERRHNRNNETHTIYRVDIGAPMPSGFLVRKEGLLHLLGKVVGVHDDIQVGNPELDDALQITGNDMVRIIRLLNIPEVGAAVLGVVIAYPRIQIGQSILVEERGMDQASRIEVVLDALCELSRALEAGMQQLAAEDGSRPTPAALR